MFNLKPKEDAFFELFVKAAQNANKAATALNNLMENYSLNSEEIISEIVEIENAGDIIKHEIEKKLLDTFITPFDREDIYVIAEKTDRFINSVQSTALRFKILHIDIITEVSKEISSKILLQSELLVSLMEGLRDKKNTDYLKNVISEMNRVESEVDHIFRNAISDLFANPEDMLNLIKLKDVYQYLEDTSDACEEVANCIEGIVTKND